MDGMANKASMPLESKLSPEGRVVIPAEVRRALGLHEGDYVRFIMESDGVRLVTPAMLKAALWANNTGGDAGDSATDIRALRDADADAVAQKYARIEADEGGDERADEELARDILAAIRNGR
jgi:AbrB family looped-hinge helix DNA binding protein